jgi:hypothetical protein
MSEDVKIEIERVVACLFSAYPNVKYIALNTGLTTMNQDIWDTHWYFVGFPGMPVYKCLDGYPAWVASDTYEISDDEWAIFFMHISSVDHVFRGVPIQRTRFDFASPRFFCWHMKDDGKIEHIIADEIEVENSEDFFNRTQNFIEEQFVQPSIDAIMRS